MTKSVIPVACVGVLGGLWIALITGSIEIFQNYVDGVWRYQVAVNSVAEVLIGAVIGVLAGANIRLALAKERADRLVAGAHIGAAVGGLLVLAQLALVALAANFAEYRIFYQPLLTRFSGIIFAATLIGAATSLLKADRPLAAPIPGAVAGAFIAAAFALPSATTNALTILTSDWVGSSELTYFVTLVLASHLSTLFAGAGGGAILGAAYEWKGLGETEILTVKLGLLLGVLVSVTASSSSFQYVAFGLLPSESSFSLMLYVLRVLVGLLCGVSVGLLVAFAMLRMIASHRNDAGMISPE